MLVLHAKQSLVRQTDRVERDTQREREREEEKKQIQRAMNLKFKELQWGLLRPTPS